MNTIEYNIAQEYSETPGTRHIKDGEFSGEDFRTTVLKDLYDNYDKVIINLDGTYGYPSSFLEEAFGGLKRIYKDKDILDKFEFICNGYPEIW